VAGLTKADREWHAMSMAYFRAALLGLAGAFLLGVAVGAIETMRLSREMEHARPNDTFYVQWRSTVVGGPARDPATLYAIGIGTGLNCAAFLALILVPTAVVIQLARRRR
jgi:hypothetical protein